jgi:hypothetical protein
VSRLTRRLDLLERHRPPRRCVTCRGWPNARVVYTDPTMADLATGWAERWDLPAARTVPERCPTCGWEPLTIRVEHTDDWRGHEPQP